MSGRRICSKDRRSIAKSYVHKRKDTKLRRKDIYWIPELHWKASFPEDFAWSTFTNTNVTLADNVATIETGQTEAILISPQFSNLTRAETYLRDIFKVRIASVVASNNSGKVYFYASNDGGTVWRQIKDNFHTFQLHHGNEGSFGLAQTKYNDLRIKVRLWRETVSETSPSITQLKVMYDNVPDGSNRRTA